jgi:hypothetical protein
VDAVPSIRGLRGRPRRRPRQQFADRGYDYDSYRQRLRERGITPRIARRGKARGSELGKVRWVVEPPRCTASKRLRTRYERRADIYLRTSATPERASLWSTAYRRHPHRPLCRTLDQVRVALDLSTLEPVMCKCVIVL